MYPVDGIFKKHHSLTYQAHEMLSHLKSLNCYWGLTNPEKVSTEETFLREDCLTGRRRAAEESQFDENFTIEDVGYYYGWNLPETALLTHEPTDNCRWLRVLGFDEK